jgi:hypothetical protein
LATVGNYDSTTSPASLLLALHFTFAACDTLLLVAALPPVAGESWVFLHDALQANVAVIAHNSRQLSFNPTSELQLLMEQIHNSVEIRLPQLSKTTYYPIMQEISKWPY